MGLISIKNLIVKLVNWEHSSGIKRRKQNKNDILTE